MTEKFYLTNVVFYDGVEAYVAKFILRGSNYEISEKSMEMLENYLSGNGEILKVDVLFDVSLENILAFNEHGDKEQKSAYDRWAKMYF